MMPTMKREQFNEMSLDELSQWAFDNLDNVHFEGTLLELAKHEIDEDNLQMALHILNGIYNSEDAFNGYYIYDRSMGTLEPVTPITCKEDLEDYIDFDEDDEDEEEFFDPDGRRSEMPWAYGNHFDDEDEEEIEIDTLYHDCSEDELRKMGCFGDEEEED